MMMTEPRRRDAAEPAGGDASVPRRTYGGTRGWNAAVSAAGPAASSPPANANRQQRPPASPAAPNQAAATQSKISVHDFDFYYGVSKVLHGINLEIPDRKVTALIGP